MSLTNRAVFCASFTCARLSASCVTRARCFLILDQADGKQSLPGKVYRIRSLSFSFLYCNSLFSQQTLKKATKEEERRGAGPIENVCCWRTARSHCPPLPSLCSCVSQLCNFWRRNCTHQLLFVREQDFCATAASPQECLSRSLPPYL